VSHRNAPLTELGRLKLARCIVEQGWPVARAAERFQVSRPTAQRWASRYHELGAVGMFDRSSRPRRSPRRTPTPVIRKVVHLRWKQRLGPAQIAPRVGLAASTVHQILVRCRINRLAFLDRATGEPVRRYERAHPGELVHIDIKKLGRIERGPGKRVTGRRRYTRSQTDAAGVRRKLIGWEYVHVAVDDYSRLAYAEILDDEKASSAIAFLRRAVAFFARHGVHVERVMTDNGSPYISGAHRIACHELGLRHLRTQPYRPRTNGKAERFIQTLLRRWAYYRPYGSSAERAAALGPWLKHYNFTRPHGSLSHKPPGSRLTNPPGNNT
jgi:transposase InsO family protein